MKNVIKLFASDVKRLSTNVVAMVVIIGLGVIPSLYAWFNILSNWDPYGESATTNLQVAVASSDQGILIGNIELNVGDIIISNLKENTTIGWIFTDTAQDAINGVYAGDYYAALVIDEEFSSDMISFLSGDIENPQIVYYENEKKNAIAPKITSKVKTTIEREVDHAFVSTMAETLLKGSEYFATLDDEGNITGRGIAKLEQLDSDLNGLISILDSYIALADSTESISNAAESVTNSANSITKLAGEMSKEAQSKGSDTKTNVQKVKNLADSEIKELNSKLDSMDSSISTISDMAGGYTFDISTDTSKLQNKVDSVKSAWGTKDDGKNYYYILTHLGLPDETNQAVIQKAEEINEIIQGLDKDVAELNQATELTEADFNNAKEKLINDSAAILNDTKYVRLQYDTNISPMTQNVIDSTASSVAEIEKLLNYNAKSIDLVMDSLDNYSSLLDQSQDSLVKSRDEAIQMENDLSKVITELKGIGQNEAYQKFMDLIQSDSDFLSDFISSPVEISDEYIYPVENNGSMTAPFYIVLSIWVGALIMSTILKTTVKNSDEFRNLKNWQAFLGRFITTFLIGQIQTVITVFGAFLFVGIQCEHPVYFWFACAWTSLIYSLLLYSFTYSFGNVGEALSVILMVIQVAGAGGTFPIEVLPKVFQVLYKFMPFNYSMNALRECIAGFYENTYRNCMLILIIYGILALFIGIVLYHPFKILNEKIENSKEKSGILI